MGQLDNRVAIITGASSGIGKGIAQAFADEGAQVVMVARNRDKLEAAANEIREMGADVSTISADITAEADVVRLFQQVNREYGRLNILINNAGVACGVPADELSLKDWSRVIDTNLTGAFLCCREALRIMKTQGSGRIINIGSVSAKKPRAFSAPYSASKAGLEGLSRALALEGREYGVTVCVLHPGNTLSGFWEQTPDLASREGVMTPADVAMMAVTMAALPDNVLVLESVMLPLKMPFLGRG